MQNGPEIALKKFQANHDFLKYLFQLFNALQYIVCNKDYMSVVNILPSFFYLKKKYIQYCKHGKSLS